MHYMKKIFVFVLIMYVCLHCCAQSKSEFRVAGFEESLFDLSAREKPTSRDDGTGSLYAIVKVTSTNPDDDLSAYNFDFGYLQHVVESKDGELWLYVQQGAKAVDITRNGYKPVRRYSLGTTIQPGKVYTMQLSPEAQVVAMQYLLFEIEPADSKAVVMIKEDGSERLLGAVDSDGYVAKKLMTGTYTYRIISENYHESEGVVQLTSPNGKHIERVSLRPNFARITLNSVTDANIYVDEEKKGTGSWNGILSPGSHTIECRMANHRSSFETITVKEGEVVVRTLEAPSPIVGTLSLSSSPLRAKITIDGKEYGETPEIIENLIVGNHKVVISKNGYTSSSIDVIINENETNEQFMTLLHSENAEETVSRDDVYGIPTKVYVSALHDPNALLCIACVKKDDGSIAYFTGAQWKKLPAKEKAQYAQLGISIKYSEQEFIIAAKDCKDPFDGDSKMKFGGQGRDFVDVINYKKRKELQSEFITTGCSDTKNIVEQVKGKKDSKGIEGAPAAEAAWNYKANKDDKLQWYLPSMSELNIIYENKRAINDFLKNYFVASEKVHDDNYWSSTEHDAESNWYFPVYNGIIASYSRDSSLRVRAVTVIK